MIIIARSRRGLALVAVNQDIVPSIPTADLVRQG